MISICSSRTKTNGVNYAITQVFHCIPVLRLGSDLSTSPRIPLSVPVSAPQFARAWMRCIGRDRGGFHKPPLLNSMGASRASLRAAELNWRLYRKVMPGPRLCLTKGTPLICPFLSFPAENAPKPAEHVMLVWSSVVLGEPWPHWYAILVDIIPARLVFAKDVTGRL